MSNNSPTQLYRLRNARGLTLETLAKRIRFPKESLAMMESGDYSLDRLIQNPDASLSIERRLRVALGTYMPLTQMLEP